MEEKITKEKAAEWENHCNKVLFNSSWNNKEGLNEIKEATICLEKSVEHPRFSSSERISQFFRMLTGIAVIRRNETLLDIAVNNSKVITEIIKAAKGKTTAMPAQTTIRTEHNILSEHMEEFSVFTNKQEHPMAQLKLLWNKEKLLIQVKAPLQVWIMLALEENGLYNLYSIIYS